jgi:hypothetical protein
MGQTAWQDGRVPWRRRALSAVALLTIAVAGERAAIAAGPRGSDNERMACGDAPRPPVRLHLVDRVGLTFEARDELKRETLAPWHAAGAAVQWAARPPLQPAGPGEPKDVYVVVEADAQDMGNGPSWPMASILFVDGQPTTHITVHAGYVSRRLAILPIDGRPLAEQPRLLRDRILGRVLGRAVAHEVGHFLSGSRGHAETGLMRASHRIDHLMVADHRMFEVRPGATAGCVASHRFGWNAFWKT